MRYYEYSPKQLEDKATELLIEFDKERLTKIKPIDVYAVIEKCLNVPYGPCPTDFRTWDL